MAFLLGACQVLTDAKEAEQFFDPEDQMDVAEMVKCLDVVGKLSEVHEQRFPQAWRSSAGNMMKFQELKVLGYVARLTSTLIIGHVGGAEEDGTHLSVSEYLERCSRLSHMLFFLFRKNKTDFCAAQNYRNWQDTVKNMFVNVALAQEHGITNFYFFLNSNNKIEQLFGISRSTRRGNLNFDCLDRRDKRGDAVLMQWIYSEHPEWDRSARRLPTLSTERILIRGEETLKLPTSTLLSVGMKERHGLLQS